MRARHLQFSWIAACLVALFLFNVSAHARYSGGIGEPDDPYQIRTSADLGAINHHGRWAHYVFVNDIDLSGMTWSVAPILDFDGYLDGHDQVISNATIRGNEYLGLFGAIGRNAVVQNLRISNVNLHIVGSRPVKFIGVFTPYNFGIIRNCSGSGHINTKEYNDPSVFGFISHNKGTISK